MFRQGRGGGNVAEGAVGCDAVHVVAVDGFVAELVDKLEKLWSILVREFVELIAVGVYDPVVGVDASSLTNFVAMLHHVFRIVGPNPG